jgi:hypothetical protein
MERHGIMGIPDGRYSRILFDRSENVNIFFLVSTLTTQSIIRSERQRPLEKSRDRVVAERPITRNSLRVLRFLRRRG